VLRTFFPHGAAALGNRVAIIGTIMVACLGVLCGAVRADLIEFLGGSKLEGKVSKIDKEARTVTIDAEISGRTLNRTYPYDKIHAVTLGEKRYVLNEKAGASSSTSPEPSKTKSSGESSAGTTKAPADVGGRLNRTRTVVEKQIEDQGRAPPDWFDDTPLDYPQTLDLAWPEPVQGGWNNQKNVGQYLWDIVNPNETRWRGGIKFMHHLLTVHQKDEAKRQRVMQSLAGMYFRFFQDYARAAFWWRKTGVQAGDPEAVSLAECYWRLGNKQMASELLKTRTVRAEAIKLWGDMGDLKQALEMADLAGPNFVKQGVSPGPVFLYAGDACRLAGRYSDAIRYYRKVVDESSNLKGRVDQNKKRAAEAIETIRLFETFDVKKIRDGTFRAASLGYEGDIEVEVTVRNQRIEDVKVVQHKEKQFYSALTDVPQQILRKQSVKGVDATSRATITAEAVLNATAKALGQAK